MVPQLWDAVRHDVDEKRVVGPYILTDSISVDEKKLKYSGAGRISRMKMYTVSLFEPKDSNGTIRFADLFETPSNISSRSTLRIEDYARLITRGGWPSTIGKNEDINRRQIAGYCDAIVKPDITTVDGVSRDERQVISVLRSYARNNCRIFLASISA